ncbi:MAG: rhodanese-like domain-containing protein [Desulfobacula sp.]|nr:rhodanese-like domain-containing protein [Desulfobacula sp.]
MKWMQFFTPAKSLDYDEAESYIAQHPGDQITILDVRQPSEYRQSHIPGATLIPLPTLDERLSELDPEKPTLVY